MSKRMGNFSASGGQRNDRVAQDVNDDGSDDDVENSVWVKKMGPAVTDQRKKKQTTLSDAKPKHEKVMFIEAMVSFGMSPFEGISNDAKTIFTEISVHGDIKGLKIMRNTKTGS